MTKLYYSALVYLVLGLVAGGYYREFTKFNDFTHDDGFTQLSTLHTHLLTLGTIVFLVAIALEKLFTLTASRVFPWFFWVYNAGLVLTAAMMTLKGSMQVLGAEDAAAIAGIAGLGHIVLGTGFVLLLVVLHRRIVADRQAATA
jgi:hypothetical protein